MEVKRLSQYITSLQRIFLENGDLEVVSVAGKEYIPIETPNVEQACESEDCPGTGYIRDNGKKVCVVYKRWALDHPMYRALNEVYSHY
jgi:hypothetical protein